MANASCLAGMAFANAFLGVNHSMARKLGTFSQYRHCQAKQHFLDTLDDMSRQAFNDQCTGANPRYLELYCERQGCSVTYIQPSFLRFGL